MDNDSKTFSLTVVNTTPMALLVGAGEVSQPLPPYGKVVCQVQPKERIRCIDPVSQIVLHDSEAAADQAVVEVSVAAVRSHPRTGSADQWVLVVQNGTRWYCDISYIDEQGQEMPHADPVAPGADAPISVFPGDLWVFRATFTRELLGLYLCSTVPSQNFKLVEVTRPIPSPKPAICGQVTTIGDVRAKPDPASRDYICISDTKNPPSDRFNTRSNVVTRNVKIAGAKVTWTKDSGLLHYAGEDVIDIASLEIYADQVEIRSPIRLPGTKVTIHARELSFSRTGCIDTTPTPWQADALSSHTVTISDITVPADASGKPTWVGESGQAGAAAGDITLFVKSLVTDDPSVKRLIAKGGKGQKAEEGGVKPYSEKKPETYRPAPKSEHGKNLTPVTPGDVNALVRKISNGVSWWRWKDGTSADDTPVPEDALRKGHVTHVTVYTLDGSAFFPSAPGMSYLPDHGGQPEWKTWPLAETDSTRLRPGDGEDAYPGGKPGPGGKGGKIAATVDAATLQAVADASGGAPGETTPLVRGLPPGEPNPAFWIGFYLVKKTPPIESKQSPELHWKRFDAKAGVDAAAVQGEPGSKGTLEAKQDLGEWLTPTALSCVLNLANDAYRNGYRDVARIALEPYFVALGKAKKSGALSGDLLGQFVIIDSLRARMANNLDYMGKPLGWLPRLNLVSDLKIVQAMRHLASEVLYFSDAALNDFDTLEGTSGLLSATSSAIESEMKATVDLLRSEYDELKNAKEALQDVLKSYSEKKRDLDTLRDAANREAQDDIAERQAYKAFMKITAGVAKAIPVGQPFAGLAGSALDSFSDVDWSADNLGEQVGKSLGKVGEATTKFLEKNEALLTKAASRDARARRDSLTDQLDDVTRDIDGVDSKLEPYKATIESRWSEARKTDVDAQKKVIAALDTQIDTANAKILEIKGKMAQAKLEQAQAIEPELKKAKEFFEQANATRDATIAVTEASKESVLAAKARLEKALKDTQNKASDEAMKPLRDRVKVLTDLTNQKVDVEKEIQTREASRKELLESLAGVGEGIGLIGEGIASAMSPVTPGSDEVKALTERLLTSKFSADYDRLTHEFEELNAKKAAAVATLASHQQTIVACTAKIATNLAERAALSQQLQSLDGVLDVSVQSYLRGMSQRARDNLRWSIYHFAKAYQYEYLRDVPDEFFNLDKWVDKLREYAKGSKRLLQRGDFSKEDYDKVEEKAFKDQFGSLARDIINSRQQRSKSKEHPYDVALSATQRTLLNENGSVTFNLVRDFDKGSFNDIDMRIVDLKLTDLKFDGEVPPHLSFDIVFKHSGESIILGPALDKAATNNPGGKASYDHYYFRAAEGDDVISWDFTYNASASTNGGNGIDTGETESERSKQEAVLLKSLLGSDVDQDYRDYFPAFFSDITLQLNPGHFRKKAIPTIAELAFTVRFSRSGTKS